MGVVTGTFRSPNGSPAAFAVYQWKLSGDAVQLSQACFVPSLISGNLDGSGNLTATFIFNDVITTGGGTNTTYQLTIKDNEGTQLWNENYYLTGTAANINLVAPGTSYAGPFFYPIIGGSAPDGIQSIAGNGTVTFGSLFMFVKASAGSGSLVQLPSAVGLGGQNAKIMRTDSGSGAATVTAAASQSINGAATWLLTNQYQQVTVESDNANWFVVGSN